MGRVVRRVPADWCHEKYSDQPLLDGFNKAVAYWDLGKENWERGYCRDWTGKFEQTPEEYKKYSYEEWTGKKPMQSDYTPDWDDDLRTCFQLYETTTEGTPLTPVFKSKEDLLAYLSTNKVSIFGLRSGTESEWRSLLFPEQIEAIA